jgi:hypothetical protein
MKKVKHKRKIIGRFRPQSKIIRFEHPAEFYPEQQLDSTHVLTCPECGEQRYVDKRFIDSMRDISEVKETMAVGIVHRGCEVQMQISKIKSLAEDLSERMNRKLLEAWRDRNKLTQG